MQPSEPRSASASFLNWADLAELGRLCREGLGYIRREGNTEHHTLIFRERVLAVACRPNGDVVTIMPMSAAGTQLARRHGEWVRARKRRGEWRG